MQPMSERKSLQMQVPPLFVCSMTIHFHSATSPELPLLELKPFLAFSGLTNIQRTIRESREQ